MASLVHTGKNARITAWRCVGCGKIDAPQPCIGICQDRKIELVDASLYDQALSRLEQTRRESEALKALLRQLAHTAPRNGQWEQSYRYLQEQARRLLAAGGELSPATAGV